MEKTSFSKKNGLFLMIVMAVLALAFTSCVKPNDPEPDPVSSYTVKTVVKGGLGTISPSGEIKVSNGLPTKIVTSPALGYRDDTIIINGVEEPLVNHEYVLIDISDEDKYTIEVEFKVDYAYILSHSWKLEGKYNLDLDDDDKVWYYTQMWGVSEQPQYVWNFSSSGKKYIYLNNGPDPVGEGDWHLNQDVTPMILNLSGKLYTVEALNLKGDSLVILDDYVPVIGGKPGQITSIKSYFSKL